MDEPIRCKRPHPVNETQPCNRIVFTKEEGAWGTTCGKCGGFHAIPSGAFTSSKVDTILVER